MVWRLQDIWALRAESFSKIHPWRKGARMFAWFTPSSMRPHTATKFSLLGGGLSLHVVCCASPAQLDPPLLKYSTLILTASHLSPKHFICSHCLASVAPLSGCLSLLISLILSPSVANGVRLFACISLLFPLI